MFAKKRVVLFGPFSCVFSVRWRKLMSQHHANASFELLSLSLCPLSHLRHAHSLAVGGSSSSLLCCKLWVWAHRVTGVRCCCCCSPAFDRHTVVLYRLPCAAALSLNILWWCGEETRLYSLLKVVHAALAPSARPSCCCHHQHTLPRSTSHHPSCLIFTVRQTKLFHRIDR